MAHRFFAEHRLPHSFLSPVASFGWVITRHRSRQPCGSVEKVDVPEALHRGKLCGGFLCKLCVAQVKVDQMRQGRQLQDSGACDRCSFQMNGAEVLETSRACQSRRPLTAVCPNSTSTIYGANFSNCLNCASSKPEATSIV